MGKKKESSEPEDRSCTTCSQWSNKDPREFPCARAKVVVVRSKPRINCRHWQAA